MRNQNGKNAAVASLVLGIISFECWFFGTGALFSVVLGIIGIVMSGNAKRQGYYGGLQTAGFVLSLLGLIGGVIVLIALAALVGMYSIFAGVMMDAANEVGGIF